MPTLCVWFCYTAVSMYVMLCLFSALSCGLGALQISSSSSNVDRWQPLHIHHLRLLSCRRVIMCSFGREINTLPLT